MNELIVALDERTYPIFINDKAVIAEQMPEYIAGTQVLVVTNTTIEPLYLADFVSTLGNYEVSTLVLEDGEIYKNLDSIQKIITKLLTLKFNRKGTLIALGGGVIGDIVGFAASIYQRGIRFIQVPTSLLAQVDSSVGGKTAVNHPLGKNMLGSFYQPKAVFINIDTLDTLPPREYISGLGEVIKYGLIRDREFFSWLVANADKIVHKDKVLLQELIYRSCKNKTEVVINDEFEEGERAFLNLGHTFGHAIEKNMNYEGILHGEAVSIGIMMAAYVSFKMGYLASEELETIKNALITFSLPITLAADFSEEAMWEAMQLDKKNQSATIRFVLLKCIGQAVLEEAIPREYISEAIALGILPK